MKNKIQIPSDPIALGRNEEVINKYQEKAEHTQQLVEDIISEYQMTGLGDPTPEEVIRMIDEGPEKMIREKIAGIEPVTVQGIKLSVKKLQEMVEIPDLTNLESAIARTKDHNHLKRADNPFNLDTVIIETGRVSIDQAKLDSFIHNQTTWLTTDAQKESYLILKRVTEDLDYLIKKYDLFCLPLNGNHTTLLHQTIEGRDLHIRKTVFNAERLKYSLENKGL